uniref:protein PRRC2A-like n=1 Tax=Callithrix jacchus TaxID=9483 RepID=UPI0023DD47C1|nr:protein PRRC2A-like [Callithrix jacchus]
MAMATRRMSPRRRPSVPAPPGRRQPRIAGLTADADRWGGGDSRARDAVGSCRRGRWSELRALNGARPCHYRPPGSRAPGRAQALGAQPTCSGHGLGSRMVRARPQAEAQRRRGTAGLQTDLQQQRAPGQVLAAPGPEPKTRRVLPAAPRGLRPTAPGAFARRPPHRWGNGSTERPRNLLKVTEPISDRART